MMTYVVRVMTGDEGDDVRNKGDDIHSKCDDVNGKGDDMCR